MAKFESLSFKTNLLAVVLLPLTVTLPDTVTALELIVPVVSIVVDPPINDAPLSVPAVITGLTMALFVKVSTPP